MNSSYKNAYLYASICFVCLISLFIFQKINLTTADLGRHLMNGQLFVHAQSLGISRSALLHTNFFSYTNPAFPFVNHHWGSGVLFYLIFIACGSFGFSALSLLYGLCIILAALFLFLIFSSGRNKTPLFLSFPVMLFLIPLISERTEVRPEGLAYLFLSIIIALLFLYTTDGLPKKWLYVVPLICLIFVNTHIYFIFAPFIIGMFLLETLIFKDFAKSKSLAIILGLSTIAVCINPYGLYGVIYPFIIFRNYGYLIAENQSIPFLIRYGISNPNFLWWGFSTTLLGISSAMVFWKNKKDFPIALCGIAITFAILSFTAIRNLTMYGLTLLPLFIYYAQLLYKNKYQNETITTEQKENHTIASVLVSIIIIIFVAVYFSDRLPWSTSFGIGLAPDVNASALFFKEKNIKGPIFSNYDIGGYLIFHLYPQEKVFVDNRPEAYPASFLQNEYIPMQDDNAVWNTELQKWNFNVIYFQRRDMTPWAQKFLIARVKDPAWAPVFVDDYTIIFLRRANKENADIIKNYELPANMFVTN